VITSFAYAFAVFFQPGVFWPELVDYKPLQIVAALALLASLPDKGTFSRLDALRHPTVKWMMAFLFVNVISVYDTGVMGMVSEFDFWFNYGLVVLVSLRIVCSERAFSGYVWGMMAGAAWIIGWGLYAVTHGMLEENGNRAGAYGMYENHNDYSFIIIQTLPFFYLLMRPEKRKAAWLFLAAFSVASIAGVFFSLSRGAIITLVLQVLIIVWKTMSGRARAVLIPIVLVVGAGAISWQYAARAANQGNDYTAEDAESSRYELWNAGENMILRHPVLGVGSQAFGEHAPEYAEISHDNLGKNAHNTFIEVTATTGVLGLATFLLMLRGAIRELRLPGGGSEWEDRVRQAALIALVSLCFRACFDAKAGDWSFYILCTIAAVSGAMRMARERRKALEETPPALSVAAPGRPTRPATNHITA
jgi:hypothetical protein